MSSRTFSQHQQRLGRTVKQGLYGFFSEYETPKLVLLHSLTFTILLRVMQIILLIYSILYLLLYEKGYQKHDSSIVSAVTLKVKGIGYIPTPENQTIVIDVADYIIPSSENNAIFIMTNYIETQQTRSICAESILLNEAICVNDTTCQTTEFLPAANGRWTGRCILPPEALNANQSTNNSKERKGLCEYSGWCPPENDRKRPMLVKEVLNFTIFIRNFIEFSEFNVTHKNMVDDLKQCIFHPEDHKDCPIFQLGYIINKAENNATEREEMLRLGGVIRIKIDWDCNLDRSIKLCKPEYSFARLDVPFRDKPFSAGFNFRYASHWKHHGVEYRRLTKAYGLRLIINVSGKAGKFHFYELTLTTGSVAGIFGLATFLCDVILFHFSKKSRIYRKHIFETVHIGTRLKSVSDKSTVLSGNSFRKNSKSKSSIRVKSLNERNNSSDEQTILSNGIVDNVTYSRKNTVVSRPLTLVNPEHLTDTRTL